MLTVLILQTEDNREMEVGGSRDKQRTCVQLFQLCILKLHYCKEWRLSYCAKAKPLNYSLQAESGALRK